ncbi:MAG: PKD domain-containing protein [Fimbriimonadaceae bacterium]
MKLTIPALAAVAAMLPLQAFGQTSLYVPTRSMADQGIELGSWGSGRVAEADEFAFEGTSSIRISTRNFFQGGIINLTNPVDLSDSYEDASNLLQLIVKVPDASTTFGGGNRGPGGMGEPGGGPAIGPAGMGPVGGPGGGRPGGGASSEQAPLGELRIIVTTTDGLKSEAFMSIDDIPQDNRGWKRVGVPLRGLRGFDRTNKEIQSIWIAGGSTATMYIGQMQVNSDPTPIYGEPNVRELNLALGDEVILSMNAFAGSSALKYEWDFDAADGINVDATGQVVRRKFRKPGEYTITVTVKDAFGVKEPYSTTIDVTVNP